MYSNTIIFSPLGEKMFDYAVHKCYSVVNASTSDWFDTFFIDTANDWATLLKCICSCVQLCTDKHAYYCK